MDNNGYSVEKKSTLLKAEEVAERLGISTAFAYRLMQRGEIRTVRLGRLVRVREMDLEVFVDGQMSEQIPSYDRAR